MCLFIKSASTSKVILAIKTKNHMGCYNQERKANIKKHNLDLSLKNPRSKKVKVQAEVAQW